MYKVFFSILMVFAFVGSGFAAQNACVASTVADIVPVDGVPGVEKGFINIRIADTYTDEPLTAGVIVDRINCQATKDWTVGDKGWAKMKLRNSDPDYLGLSFKCPGYIPVSYSYRKKAGVKIPTQMKVYLEQGLDIGGYVKNGAGEPIEGVTVEMWSHSFDEDEEFRRNIREISGKTDVNGFWKIEKVWPDDEFGQPKILLKHPDYIDDRWGNEYISPNLEKLKKFEDSYVMKSGLTICGTVTDQDGKPLVKALVKSGDDWFPSNHEPGVRTDENGKFTFKAMKPSNWTFTAEYKDLAPQLITMQIDKDTEGIEFSLKPGKTIKIKVVDKDGKPIKGVGVCADTWKGKRTLTWRKNTDKDGMVTWTNMPDEEVLFDVYCKGHMDNRNLPLEAKGDEVHKVVLSDPLVINVTVVDAKTGELVKEFKGYRAIMWENSNSGPSIERGEREAKVGKDGKLEARFTHGHYKTGLLIEADGYYPKQSEYFLSNAGNVACVVELEKGSNLAGTIVTPEGDAAAGATMLVKSVGGNFYIENGIGHRDSRTQMRVKADEQGKFSMPPQEVIEGVYIIHESGYKLFKVPGREMLKNIRLDKWVTVEGTAMTGSKPFANSEVAINGSHGGGNLGHFGYRAKTDEQGRFKFENVIVMERMGVSKAIVIHRSSGGGYSTSYSCRTEISPKPGDHITGLVVGGGGRNVTGKFVIAGANENLNWRHGSIRMRGGSSGGGDRMPSMLMSIKQFWMGSKAHGGGNSSVNYAVKINSSTGEFEIQDVKPGSYQLSVTLYQKKENGRRYDEYDYQKRTVKFNKTITVVGGDIDKGLDLGIVEVEANEDGMKYYGIADVDAAAEGSALELPSRVLLPSGEPAVGAKVVLCTGGYSLKVVDGKFKESKLPMAITDSAGEFKFDVEDAQKHPVVVLHESGYAIVRKSAKPDMPKEIQLAKFAMVKGRLNFNGRENSGKELLISGHSEMYLNNFMNISINTEVKSGDDGTFVIDKVIPGTFMLTHKEVAGIKNMVTAYVSTRPGETVNAEISDEGIVGVGKFKFKPADYAQNYDPHLCTVYLQPAAGGDEVMPEFPQAPDGLAEDEKFVWYNDWMRSDAGWKFVAENAPRTRMVIGHAGKDGTFSVNGLKAGNYRLIAYVGTKWGVGTSGGINGRVGGGKEFVVASTDDSKEADLGTFEMVLQSAIPEKPKVVVGDLAPEFNAAAIDGQMQQWYRLKGNYIVLDFWATWCPDCVKVLPEVKELFAKYSKNKKFKMVGVALENDEEKLKKFAEDNGMLWPQILAQGWKGEFAKIYNIKSIPQMFLIGPDGKIVAVGGVDDIEAVLEKKLSGK